VGSEFICVDGKETNKQTTLAADLDIAVVVIAVVVNVITAIVFVIDAINNPHLSTPLDLPTIISYHLVVIQQDTPLLLVFI